MGDWMMTHTGRHVDPLNVRAEDICLEDIAFALSNLCRFGGHVRFYSVAEHCVRVCRAAPPELQRAALLHDAAEAYIGDIIRPLKRSIIVQDADQCGGYADREPIRDLEERIMCLIDDKWGDPPEGAGQPIADLDYLDCIAAGIDAWGVDAILGWHRGPELALNAQQWLYRAPIKHMDPIDARDAFLAAAGKAGIN